MHNFLQTVRTRLGAYSRRVWLLMGAALLVAAGLIGISYLTSHWYPARVALDQRVAPTIEDVTYQPDVFLDDTFQGDGEGQVPPTYGKYPTTAEDFLNTAYGYIELDVPWSTAEVYHFSLQNAVTFANGSATVFVVSESVNDYNNLRHTLWDQAATSTERGAVPLELRITTVATTTPAYAENRNGVAVAVALEVTFQGQTHTALLTNLHQYLGEGQSAPKLYSIRDATATQPVTRITDFSSSTLSIVWASGETTRYILESPYKHTFQTLASPLTPDGQFKLYRDPGKTPRFEYPKEYTTKMSYYSIYNRAEAVEQITGKQPVYYDGACGLEPQLSDDVISLGIVKRNDTVATQANRILLGWRKLGPDPVYLTTSYIGYDPAAWNTIQRTIYPYSYAASVAAGGALPGKVTERVTIAGKTTRHIPPFRAGRPCDTQYREQYQWVTDQHLITVNVSYLYNAKLPPDTDATRNLLEHVAGSLQFVDN